jgi:hypothetical protein
VAQRPVYSPALVAWVGGDAVGGGVGWFALGPREVYVPSYHTSPTYLNRINVSNTVIVNNVNITNVNITNVNYVNRAAPGAVMAVQREAFASAKPVQSAAVAVNAQALRSAPIIATASVAPTRASVVRTAAPGANVVRPPAALEARPVIAKKTAPPPPVPFAQKQAALAGNAGRPLDKSQVQQLRQAQPAPARPLVRQVQARTPASGPAPRSSAPAPASAAPQVQTTKPAPQVRETTPAPQRTVPPAAERAVPPAHPTTPAPAETKPSGPPAKTAPGAQPSTSSKPVPSKVPAKDDKQKKDGKKDEKKDEKSDKQ